MSARIGTCERHGISVWKVGGCQCCNEERAWYVRLGWSWRKPSVRGAS